MSGRRPVLVAVAVALAVAAAVAYATGTVPDPTHGDGFCLSCHADLVSSHAGSAHREIACIRCHMESGLAGEAEGRWHGFRHLRLGVLADPADPRHPPMVSVPSATCQGCHRKLTDELTGTDWDRLVRPTGDLGRIGLRMNHGGHLDAVAACATCHGPAYRPQSQDPLACTACHATVAHGRERTARARSLTGKPVILAPVPPAAPPPPPVADGEGDGDGNGSAERLRCSARGMARCGTCHNGQSHGNGTKPPSLPNVHGADDTFTCRRCHPQGRW